MTSFIAAVLAVIGISIGASILLETQQRTADTAYTTSGARVDLDPRLNGAPATKH
jgi:hypothetical protein